MKVRYLGTLLLAILTFYGCDDNTGTLGMGMLPDSDGMTSNTMVFDVITESVLADSVYAKTSTGYVGKFTDKEFGYYEASFLTELNCTDNFSFPKVYKYDPVTKTGSGELVGDTISSAQLVIYYSSWFGDSLNACRMSVYELQKKLDKNRYTNINPEEYYKYPSPPKLLGRKAYTAFDTTVPDSVRFEKDANGNYTFYPNIVFPLDKEECTKKFLLAYRENPDNFKNAAKFIENIFKGIYVKSDYGDGTILYIDQVALQFKFHLYAINDTTGVAIKTKDGKQDSLYYGTKTFFASTKEVIQANHFFNSDMIKKKVDEKDWTYIKSPAGILTQATMPYDKIYEKLSKDTLNAVKLTFTNYDKQNNYKFSMSAPKNVLLIRKKDLKSFFEENKLTDNVTSFTVSHNNVATNQYTFKNIARLVTTCINEKQAAKKKAKEVDGASWNENDWERKWVADNPDWDKVLLIPIAVTYDYSNSQNPTMTGIENDLQPGYAQLKGGPLVENGVVKNPLKIEVTHTSFNN